MRRPIPPVVLAAVMCVGPEALSLLAPASRSRDAEPDPLPDHEVKARQALVQQRRFGAAIADARARLQLRFGKQADADFVALVRERMFKGLTFEDALSDVMRDVWAEQERAEARREEKRVSRREQRIEVMRRRRREHGGRAQRKARRTGRR